MVDNIDYTLSLSPEQRQFKVMLSSQPRLEAYFDFKTRQLDLEALDKDMASLSHGEKMMAQFLAGVWLGEDRYTFNFFGAVEVLDHDSLSVISSWMNEPYWP